ncbi:uncharacterized protein MONBRDRAFT_35537 [Monosiga brevicollis MX1]|uniref:HMA domain-containing protein n=1 Tax=Monosiga brevicollis TaxID=81824 RepID=A9UPS8_MONBE|nr:uncharacterized protein MONBRDRAFT_35537 [Monosiga brevicollis MX1]EDQ92923.1 predicted protein [Monosiga brevicollis MX1]|eukprot:XP_001742685.1 hypothetical protein [Monosiga brevicollis MX1]
MDILGVVTNFRDLAREPKNRPVIGQDAGSLGSLILCLDSEPAVVEIAVEALYYLSLCEDNLEPMKQSLGLTDSLRAIVRSPSSAPQLSQWAHAILSTFDMAGKPELLATMQTPVHNGFFKGKINKMARTIVLQIDGLNDLYSRNALEQRLLQVKGVVSFTFDMKTARITIRVRDWLQMEVLCDAVADTGMAARQVVRDDDGQEVMLSFGASPSKFNKENAPMPDYLDEHEMLDPEADRKAVVHSGSENQNGGWFSAIGGYLSRNLYW